MLTQKQIEKMIFKKLHGARSVEILIYKCPKCGDLIQQIANLEAHCQERCPDFWKYLNETLKV